MYRVLSVLLFFSLAHAQAQLAPERLFPAGLPHAEWTSFPARGYDQSVSGIIYRGKPRPTCGMPLGGLDTGCLDIEPNGFLGYNTIFNYLIQPRHLENLPFAGLVVDGKTWLLATDLKAKKDAPVFRETGLFPPVDYTPHYADVKGLKGVRLARSIDYWGHYPILDLQYQTDAPVTVGMRAWSPFLPGVLKESMLPGAVFEVTLANPTTTEQQGSFLFSFPGFNQLTDSTSTCSREELTDGLRGIRVHTDRTDHAWQMEYVLAVTDESAIRTGGALLDSAQAWNQAGTQLPTAGTKQSGATVAVDFKLAPGATKTMRYILAWHAPRWQAAGAPNTLRGRTFTHMYARHWADALATAQALAAGHKQLLNRVIAWQQAIYHDPKMPGWLADSLINNLHLITETSVWAQSGAPLGNQFRKEDGLFAMNECPRGCAQLECIPCTFYGNIPIVYFFPEAALANLRGYKAYQLPDGRPPWIFGGVTANEAANKDPYDLAAPDAGYQTVLNGASYVVLVDRLWQTSGDDKILSEFWDSLKKANEFSLNLRPKFGLSQVMAMPEPGTDRGGLGDTEWFEAPEPGWKGYVTHAGAIRMAQVQLMKRMARQMKDDEYVKRCDAWLEAGRKVLEEKLWNGSYYLNFFDPVKNLRSDLIFGYQLDGEWITRIHGVDGVFPEARLRTTLDTIRNANVRLSQSGATNYANPDGTAAKVGGYGTYGYFPPELMMLAMTYMEAGQREFGLDLLQRCMSNISETWGYIWDFPNTIRGDMDTGQRHFGADYYQNLMLWFAPCAVENQTLAESARAGGFVHRVLDAAKAR
jgi:uncharacterized protein (DUF608 family)